MAFLVDAWVIGLGAGGFVGVGLGSLANHGLRLLKRNRREKTRAARLRALPDAAFTALSLLLEERNHYAYSSADGDQESFDALVKAGLAS